MLQNSTPMLLRRLLHSMLVHTTLSAEDDSHPIRSIEAIQVVYSEVRKWRLIEAKLNKLRDG